MATTKQKKENVKDNLDLKEVIKIKEDKKAKEVDLQALLQTVQELKEKIDSKDEIIENLRAINQRNETSSVKIINMSMCNRSQYRLSNGLILTFERLYQTYPTSKENALLLINEYFDTFTKGNLTLDNEHLYMLEEAGIDINQINYNYEKSMEKTGKMSQDELAKYYNSLTLGQKESFKNFIVSKIQQDKKDFMPMEHLRELNKLSKGGYRYILNKLSEQEEF